MYRAYTKDALHPKNKPTHFFRISEATFGEDLLAKKTSEFTAVEKTAGVEPSDIFVLMNGNGIVKYMGIVDSVEDHVIHTSQMQAFYRGSWSYTQFTGTIEQQAQMATLMFSQGRQTSTATGQDTMMMQEKAIFVITCGTSTAGKLPVPDDTDTVMDFEEFIYQLYDQYGIVYEFDLPYESGGMIQPALNIFKPNYTTIAIGDNAHAIVNMEPIEEVYDTNKLVIRAEDGTYRNTYYATTQGITTNPADPNRFKTITTAIVYSDEAEADIVPQHLQTNMYNHMISFDLIIDNNLYDFEAWKLGQPLKIYYDGAIYNSVWTGYEREIINGEVSGHVHITCGKVRSKLTNKLNYLLS